MEPVSIVYNEDNMIGMARYPDKFFDLAIIDPPYGISEDGGKSGARGSWVKQLNGVKTYVGGKTFKPAGWDTEPPPVGFFVELMRVSKNQIIWGANHFIDRMALAGMKIATPCWIVWDKVNYGSNFADCELAWTSFNSAVRQIEFMWNGMMQGKSLKEGRVPRGDKTQNAKKIHPTQKPVELYEWLLSNYAKRGFKILDTNLGSGSHRIAAWKMGLDFYAWENYKEYYDNQERWFQEVTSKPSLFTPSEQYPFLQP